MESVECVDGIRGHDEKTSHVSGLAFLFSPHRGGGQPPRRSQRNIRCYQVKFRWKCVRVKRLYLSDDDDDDDILTDFYLYYVYRAFVDDDADDIFTDFHLYYV